MVRMMYRRASPPRSWALESDIGRAILWGSIWTGIGATAATVLAKAMVETFGKKLLGAQAHPTIAGALAAISGAALYVLFATQLFGLEAATKRNKAEPSASQEHNAPWKHELEFWMI